MDSNEIDKVSRYLLRVRDLEIRNVIGIGKREITDQFVKDLYSLPGSGGSDERRLAKEWFFREVALFGDHKNWEKLQPTVQAFYSPTIMEMEQLAHQIGRGRSR